MSAYNKFNQFVEDLAHKKHDLSADQLAVAFTNSEPSATNSVLADITEIDYTNLSSRDLVRTSSGQTTGTYSLILEDLNLTASGSVPQWKYVVIYNKTATNNPLIGWYERDKAVEMVDGDIINLDFTDAQTLLEVK